MPHLVGPHATAVNAFARESWRVHKTCVNDFCATIDFDELSHDEPQDELEHRQDRYNWHRAHGGSARLPWIDFLIDGAESLNGEKSLMTLTYGPTAARSDA